MASHSQQHQEASKQGGGRQAVVELCGITHCGLTFWSRQRFEIGAELQIRVRSDAVPPALQSAGKTSGEWITVCGYVVECPAIRREDGSHAFRVSLLFESALDDGGKTHDFSNPASLRFLPTVFPGQKNLGFN